eukprot:scaffold823_cov397-Prasinococcus_capsulatus_cf.AAC.14
MQAIPGGKALPQGRRGDAPCTHKPEPPQPECPLRSFTGGQRPEVGSPRRALRWAPGGVASPRPQRGCLLQDREGPGRTAFKVRRGRWRMARKGETGGGLEERDTGCNGY